MRELFFVSDTSTHASLVLSSAPEGSTSDTVDEFFLTLDDATRRALLHYLAPEAEIASTSRPDSEASSEPDSEPDSEAGDHLQDSTSPEDTIATGDNADAGDATVSLNTEDAGAGDSTADNTDTEDSTTGTGGTADNADAEHNLEDSANQENSDPQHDSQNHQTAQELSPSSQEASEELPEQTPALEVDPKLTRPLSMRPREIQDRIRAGASVKELAEMMGVAESRVEPYAHPVLAERRSITESAKQAHPIIDEKTSSETLYEVLAQAFASRHSKLSSAHWDAYRDESKQWIVCLSWHRGLSMVTAEWAVHRDKNGSSTVEPINAEAADLIDPNFVRPVRRLATITSLQPKIARSSGAAIPSENSPTIHGGADADPDSHGVYGSPSDNHSLTPSQPDASQESDVVQDDAEETAPDGVSSTDSEALQGEDSFLLNPSASDARTTSGRRKRTVTPRWEDLLLGIRTNTKHTRK